MKILYATMQFGRGYAQGTERYVAMLAGGMRQRGHEVTILAGDPERRRPQRELGELVQDDPRTLHYPSRGWMSVQGISGLELAGFLDRERPDVVHIANPAHIGVGVLTAAALCIIPTVITIMDFWWLCPNHTLLHYSGDVCEGNVPWRECLRCIAGTDKREWVKRFAGLPLARQLALPVLYFGKAFLRGNSTRERGLWRRRARVLASALESAGAVIFPSRGARQRLAPRIDAARAHPIPYGLEPRWFAAEQPRREHKPLDPAGVTIGYAGALAAHKGPHLLLEALHQLGWMKTRVRIAGGGADARYVERLRELAAGLNVEFVGRVDSADMPAFLRGLDLFSMTSIWPENLPIVVLEAQAVGVPVLASRIDGVTETVPELMLFEANSSADLARRLDAWVRDPVSPSPLSPVSTADEMVDRTLQVYGEVCGLTSRDRACQGAAERRSAKGGGSPPEPTAPAAN